MIIALTKEHKVLAPASDNFFKAKLGTVLNEAVIEPLACA